MSCFVWIHWLSSPIAVSYWFSKSDNAEIDQIIIQEIAFSMCHNFHSNIEITLFLEVDIETRNKTTDTLCFYISFGSFFCKYLTIQAMDS